MKFEEIQDLWSKDCVIDRTNLQGESASIGQLFSKYFNILRFERRELKKLRHHYLTTKKEKHDFFMNPDPERMKRLGWEPPSHHVRHTETPIYIEGDEDCQKVDLQIADQETKCEYLEEILRLIKSRSFAIRDIIEDRKFMGMDT